MNTKEDTLIKEFLEKGNLIEFQPIIINLFESIKNYGFIISSRYDSYQSFIDWDDKRIMISLITKNNLHILCDILHELGHILSGEKNENTNMTTYERESLAWDHAYQEFIKYEPLHKYKKVFDCYKIKCLSTYNHIKY